MRRSFKDGDGVAAKAVVAIEKAMTVVSTKVIHFFMSIKPLFIMLCPVHYY